MVCGSNPSVLVVKTSRGNLQLIVGAGDLIPSFSFGEPSIEWHLYEELPFGSNGKLLSSQALFYLTDRAIYKVDMPWVEEAKNAYALKRTPKGLSASSVTEIRQGEAFSICWYGIGMKKALVVSLNRGYEDLGLKSLGNNKEPTIKIDRKYLECETKNLPDLGLPSVENLRRTTAKISGYEGEEKEIMKLIDKFDEFFQTSAVPLANKIEAIKEMMEDMGARDIHLAKNYQIIEERLGELEIYSGKINEKIARIYQNDQDIRKRIQDVVDIQQNVKRPLTEKEKELSNKLTHLENVSKQLKNHAAEVMNR